ncbi:MAG: hypothetical protein Q8O07_05295 [Chloroflexota bacterium]|nr:hypothetical protein [Chloroflexota bacterium]
MADDDVSTLAWQLRSGSLALADGKVESYTPMLQTATPAMVAELQARAGAINEIIDREGFDPKTIEELVAIFNIKEADDAR